jgi:hypothetical protein
MKGGRQGWGTNKLYRCTRARQPDFVDYVFLKLAKAGDLTICDRAPSILTDAE